MGLVRKTNSLRNEINDELDKIVETKVKKLMSSMNLATLINNVVSDGFTKGQWMPIPIQENFNEMLKHDGNNSLDICTDLENIEIQVWNILAASKVSGKYNGKRFFYETMKLPQGKIKVPSLRSGQWLGLYSTGMVHVAVGVRQHSSNPEVLVHLVTHPEGMNIKEEYPMMYIQDHWVQHNPSGKDMFSDDEHTDAQNEAMAKLTEARDKVEKSIRRIEAVRSYIFDTLWPNCASLNSMAKPFPGILEYISDDTLRRYHKNAPRSTSLDPNLIPDATVLAATAEAKLK